MRGNKSFPLCSGQAWSQRGSAGQWRGLLIYTFHKIIHVRGIPLPIWLGRTRAGGVFMEPEPSQKGNTKGNGTMDKHCRGLITINANIGTCVKRRLFEMERIKLQHVEGLKFGRLNSRRGSSTSLPHSSYTSASVPKTVLKSGPRFLRDVRVIEDTLSREHCCLP